jgi:hypothetical protein
MSAAFLCKNRALQDPDVFLKTYPSQVFQNTAQCRVGCFKSSFFISNFGSLPSVHKRGKSKQRSQSRGYIKEILCQKVIQLPTARNICFVLKMNRSNKDTWHSNRTT